MADILVVEDSKSMRDIIETTLSNAGHNIDTAIDGQDAIDKIKFKQYQMILTDLNMPNKTGMSLLASVRRLPAYDEVPVLIITTEDNESAKRKSKGLGANGWVTKPITSTRLLTAVSTTLEKYNIS